MNQQILDYLRIIGLKEKCLIWVLLVALLFLAQRLRKRIEGHEHDPADHHAGEQNEEKLADLASRADEIMGRQKGGGAE